VIEVKFQRGSLSSICDRFQLEASSWMIMFLRTRCGTSNWVPTRSRWKRPAKVRLSGVSKRNGCYNWTKTLRLQFETRGV